MDKDIQDAVTEGVEAWRKRKALDVVDTSGGTSFSTYLPAGLYGKLKAECAARKVSYNQGIAQSIRLWLSSNPSPRPKPPRVTGARRIIFGNQKGGVGKTSVSAGVAQALAETGKRTLLIDFDPQGHLTKQLGYDLFGIDEASLAKHILKEAKGELGELGVPIKGGDFEEPLWLLPACKDAFLLDAKLVTTKAVRIKESALEKALEPLEQEFDYIVVDCPPSLGYSMDTALYYGRTRDGEEDDTSGIVVPVLAGRMEQHRRSRCPRRRSRTEGSTRSSPREEAPSGARPLRRPGGRYANRGTEDQRMSKADQLGTGRWFVHVGRGGSARGRAKAVAQGDLPTYELVRLHLEEVSPTPLNPRRNFGTEAELTRFGEELRQAQLAACVAVTRDAYLTLWPDRGERIGSAKRVLINGERRYRSANQVGLEALDFVVRDDLASSREQFVNHLLKENLEREDFDVIERARGVQQLVDVCAEESQRGARSRAAEQLGKDRSWVTNQLTLLELPEELQTMLSAGSLAERDGRLLARHLKDNPGLDAAGLMEHLEQSKAQAAAVKEQDRAALEAARKASARTTAVPLLSADNKPSGQSDEERESAKQSDVPPGASSSETSSSLPGPRHDGTGGTAKLSDQGGGKQPRVLPYNDPIYIVRHLGNAGRGR